MSFGKTLAGVGQTNPSRHWWKYLVNIDWKIDSTNVSRKIASTDISWQMFPAYFDKKTLFDVDWKNSLSWYRFKNIISCGQANNPS